MREAPLIRWPLAALGGALLLTGGCLESRQGTAGTVGDGATTTDTAETTPPRCCTTADDCDGGGLVCVAGFCLQPLSEPGRCWQDADCGGDRVCAGDSVCSCEAPCPGLIEPGWCMDAAPSCCYADHHCDVGEVCAMGDAATGGRCVPAPGDGRCYTAAHCDGGACAEATTCPCFSSSCAPAPGLCLGPGCCASDDACATDNGKDYVCHAGSCVEVPPAGQCWRDEQCGPAERCTGGSACPCGLLCAVGNIPGRCVPDLPDACCLQDAECGPGRECAHEIYQSSFGTCVDAVPAGECWDDQDCPGSETCEGESTCPCGIDCAQVAPGVCSGRIPACCAIDEDCPSGYACGGAYADATGAPSGVCKPRPLSAGACWGQAHCPHGAWCLGAQVCPCDADCDGADQPGTCVALPTGCCAGDADCGGGFVCRGLWGDLPGRCVPDPNGPQCPGDAACCWDRDDCGATGSTSCQGASVCGCIALCPSCGACQPDQMGWCP
ncbi:MAG: hypothetical protein EP329_12945 [Deltaproteobacteria bacterium]|nr:MAG: hypothetical protein EP329_12945 [Deltaproteobacteria bacterium]